MKESSSSLVVSQDPPEDVLVGDVYDIVLHRGIQQRAELRLLVDRRQRYRIALRV